MEVIVVGYDEFGEQVYGYKWQWPNLVEPVFMPCEGGLKHEGN